MTDTQIIRGGIERPVSYLQPAPTIPFRTIRKKILQRRVENLKRPIVNYSVARWKAVHTTIAENIANLSSQKSNKITWLKNVSIGAKFRLTRFLFGTQVGIFNFRHTRTWKLLGHLHIKTKQLHSWVELMRIGRSIQSQKIEPTITKKTTLNDLATILDSMNAIEKKLYKQGIKSRDQDRRAY